MNKVFIVVSTIDYGKSEIEGVFSCKKEAEKFAEKRDREDCWAKYEVEAWFVDSELIQT